MRSFDESAAPRKAYRVEVMGGAVKHLIVWADSVNDAWDVARNDRYSPDVEVVDTDFWETAVRRPRRLPEEDR